MAHTQCRLGHASVAVAPEAVARSRPAIMSAVNAADDKPKGPLRRHVLYPTQYTWFVFVSAIDLMFTCVVLTPAIGAYEVNTLANTVIERYGLTGLAVYKFSLVAFVIIMCEYIGRRRADLASKLAVWSVALPAVAVVVSVVILLAARTRMLD